MGNNMEHSLDRIERNADEYVTELTANAETPAPLPHRMGLLSEDHVNTIATALASQRIEFAKLTTGGTEATNEYFTTRLAEIEEAYSAVIHFGHAGL